MPKPKHLRPEEKKKKKYLLSMNLPVTLLALLLCTLYVALISLAIQPGGLSDSTAYLFKEPLLILLNTLPALVLILVFCMVRGNVFSSAAFSGLILWILSYANLLKEEGRSDPLVPADIPLLRESLSSVSSYKLNLHIPWIVIMAGSFAVLLVLSRLIGCKKPKWFIRIPVGLLAAGGMVAAVFTIYASSTYYSSLPEIDIANVPQVFNRYGFNYCFLHNFTLYNIERPEGYSLSEVKEWQTETLDSDEEPLKVNVLFVMGEAFTDLSDEEAFGYTDETSPIAAYHRVCDSEQSVSGHIVASNIDAGTANTEFDVLTGMQTNMVSPTNSSSFRCVHTGQESLARIFSEDGAATWFMHPGQSWFYNRCNVYNYFGIEDQTFNDAFSAEDYDGTFITDQAFLRVLEQGWEERTADGSTLFTYATTIENHQAYVYGKYASTPDVTLSDSLNLSDSAREYLSVYFYGAKHTADMIEELTEWMDTLDEPTILIFFGDHRPNLGADQLSYKEAGSAVGLQDTPEEVFYTYSTPFLIRANTALCEEIDFQAAVESLDLPEGNLISSSYLGSLIYELTGHTGESAYWDYLTEARRILPVISHGCYMLPDGTGTTELNEEQQAVLDKLDRWEYARLKNGLNLLD